MVGTEVDERRGADFLGGAIIAKRVEEIPNCIVNAIAWVKKHGDRLSSRCHAWCASVCIFSASSETTGARLISPSFERFVSGGACFGFITAFHNARKITGGNASISISMSSVFCAND